MSTVKITGAMSTLYDALKIRKGAGPHPYLRVVTDAEVDVDECVKKNQMSCDKTIRSRSSHDCVSNEHLAENGNVST